MAKALVKELNWQEFKDLDDGTIQYLLAINLGNFTMAVYISEADAAGRYIVHGPNFKTSYWPSVDHAKAYVKRTLRMVSREVTRTKLNG